MTGAETLETLYSYSRDPRGQEAQRARHPAAPLACIAFRERSSHASMIEHVVLCKTTRSFTVEEKTSICNQIKQIPGVLSITVGANYTTRGLEYNTGIVVRLTSKEAEVAYQTHPIHVSVRDSIIKPLIDKGTDGTPPILVVDYECADIAPASLIGAVPAEVYHAAVCSLAVGALIGCAVALALARPR